MSAVQVPAELIERMAGEVVDYWMLVHSDYCSGGLDEPGCRGHAKQVELVDAARALLPAPAPTCPNCQHRDDDHQDAGCMADAADPATTLDAECPCAISKLSLPQVRALLAAERDSKPAQRQPRVFNAGDPDPRDSGVTLLVDVRRRAWHAQGAGWSAHWPNASGQPDNSWERMDARDFPFTEVLDGGEVQ